MHTCSSVCIVAPFGVSILESRPEFPVRPNDDFKTQAFLNGALDSVTRIPYRFSGLTPTYAKKHPCINVRHHAGLTAVATMLTLFCEPILLALLPCISSGYTDGIYPLLYCRPIFTQTQHACWLSSTPLLKSLYGRCYYTFISVSVCNCEVEGHTTQRLPILLYTMISIIWEIRGRWLDTLDKLSL
jgi:hypothetical protein